MDDLEVAWLRRLDLGDDLVLVAEGALHNLDAGLGRVWLDGILVDCVLHRPAPTVEANFLDLRYGAAQPGDGQAGRSGRGRGQPQTGTPAEIAVHILFVQPFEPP